MKRTILIFAILALALAAGAQVKLESEPVAVDWSKVQSLDAQTEAIILQAPDDEAKLTAIRALIPTTETESNWLARAEARVLTKLGEETQAVDVARRIPESDMAAMTELWVRFNASNYSKVMEVGEPLLAKPRAELLDVYRLRAADTVTRAMKASLGDGPVTRSNRVRVVTMALTNIEHTTLFNLTHKDSEPVPQLVTRLVNFVRRDGATNAEQAAMLRHLVRITPVTQQTMKTVGDWKGSLARQGQTNVVLNELIESPAVLDVMEVYAALAERNIRPPYRNSVFGEAYQRGDVTLMRRYVETLSKQPWR